LDAGADPTIADSQGNTALHLLLGHKFHVDKPTSTVDSPRATIIDSLLAVPSVDLNAANNEGETPLFAYIRRGGSACNNTKDHVHTSENDEKWEEAMMDLLDARGANWCARNGAGKTLLHVAVEAEEWNLTLMPFVGRLPTINFVWGIFWRLHDMGSADN
jgi:ankyrin repeat protein